MFRAAWGAALEDAQERVDSGPPATVTALALNAKETRPAVRAAE